MAELAIKALVVVAQLLLLIGLPWLAYRWLRSGRPSATPLPITDDGSGRRAVPLVTTFSGVRGVPWIGFATNNLNPRLVLGPSGLDYRVLGSRSRRYDEIREVDVRIFGATVNLIFSFHDSLVTFEANVGSTVLAAQVLELLPRDVILSARAAELVKRPAGG